VGNDLAREKAEGGSGLDCRKGRELRESGVRKERKKKGSSWGPGTEIRRGSLVISENKKIAAIKHIKKVGGQRRGEGGFREVRRHCGNQGHGTGLCQKKKW